MTWFCPIVQPSLTCMNPSILMESKLEEDLRILFLDEDPRAERNRHHLVKVAKRKANNNENKITNKVSYLERGKGEKEGD